MARLQQKAKAPPDLVGGRFGSVWLQRLEDEFDRQLDLERLARTNAGCSLGVRDRVLDPAEAALRIATEQTRNTPNYGGDVATAFMDAAKDGGQESCGDVPTVVGGVTRL